jgi:hypothetical protein
MEAERLVAAIALDSRHQANDRRHPGHARAAWALKELESKIDAARAEVDARRMFDF